MNRAAFGSVVGTVHSGRKNILTDRHSHPNEVLPMEWSLLPSCLPSAGLDRALVSSGGSALASEGVVHRPSILSCHRTSRTSMDLLVQPHLRKFHHSLETFRLHTWSYPVYHLKIGFSRKVVRVAAWISGAPLQPFTSPNEPGSLVGVMSEVSIHERPLSLK